MANTEHLKQLTDGRGIPRWNEWRRANPAIRPDLQEADVAGADLSGAHLQGADLRRAHLQGADLRRAQLRGADLRHANLQGADLRHANLQEANLQRADLSHAQLDEAQLQAALLQEASLRATDLQEAAGLSIEQFSGADLANAKLPHAAGVFAERLARIDASTSSLQQTIFSLLGLCIYCGLTIFATTDVQLITNTGAKPLPIIGTELPIVWFYLFASLFLLGFYIYCHLYLQPLWEMLADLPAVFPDGKPLDKKISARLLSGFVQTHSFQLQRSCLPIAHWQSRLFIAIVWGTVPATLFLFWGRYLPRHDWFGTFFTFALLMVSLLCGGYFYQSAQSTLQGQGERAHQFSGQGRFAMLRRDYGQARTVLIGAVIASLVLVLLLYNILPPCAFPDANLTGVDVSTRPPNWLGQNEADFAVVKGAALRQRNLRCAEAFQAFFVRANLAQADLTAANLRQADLRKADLQMAALRRADLVWATLAWADLRQAVLVHADFTEANLSKASLSVFTDCHLGCLRPVNLWGASFLRANLEAADFKGADLGKATLQWASLHKATLQGACLQEANLQGANLHEASFGGGTIAPICASDPRRQCPRLPGHLYKTCTHRIVQEKDAQGNMRTILPGADLTRANLTKADLTGADLTAANLRLAVLRGATLAGARLDLANLHGADLQETQELTQAQLATACVDEETRLPGGLTRRERPEKCRQLWP